MTAREWKPGDVAMAQRADGGDDFLVVRTRGDGDYWSAPKGWPWGVPSESLAGFRPLVVLDLELIDTRPQDTIPYLVRALRASDGDVYGPTLRMLADQIEAQTAPPKPPEPGKYGVVVAGDGCEWIRWTTSERAGRDWCRPGTDGGTEYARWDDLDVIRVVREGVTA